MSQTAFPSDVPASSFADLQQRLFTNRLVLGVARDHAKDWWTLGAESPGRWMVTPFVYFPILVGLAIVIGAIIAGRYTWLIALPIGLVAMVVASPMNPGRVIAVVLGAALVAIGWVAGWSSLVVSGAIVLGLYAEMKLYYGLGYRAFRRFLVHDSEGFRKYWDAGIVWLQDPASGRTYHHQPDPSETAI